MTAAALWAQLKPDARGLVPAVCVDRATGAVLMVAYQDEAAFGRTLAGGRATFFSRSRGRLWEKGETSGHTLTVVEVRVDCDGDCVLLVCDPAGPACHTGARSCFYRTVAGDALVADGGPAGGMLAEVERVIAARRTGAGARSYTRQLLDAGWVKILAKIAEESAELAAALPAGDPGHTVHEAADLVFHVLVGLAQAGIPVSDVMLELRRRFGTSGLDEKAARGR
ncbi:MAG TPA: bifunctional phosphoribosyl-AMP cyclohydrolase/phosphoribosyl-ATP diphosphatase HisIE [Polyangia bacterium]